ncbi:helix-turn-helix domain-containing protein [Phytohabitans houttuyneae]|uniref:helix-turn-helix domain-containing protein n=1 Tax=Phytohabitans houttuyneae TaxID=1076126 RepID=UPI0015663F15|nr:helix-turn-helix transcriptional regulator [Phytohabitans houttuyneae]
MPHPRDPEDAGQLTDVGKILEDARESLRLSKREAARRAGISEGRWRQVVTGVQKAGNVTVPVNPRASTVSAMAQAVGVDPALALRAAGFSDEDIHRFGSPTREPTAWQHKLEEVQAIADNQDRSPALRAWAARQLDDIEAILAAARAEEDAQRRGQAS